jgi:hypothetical protein
VAIIALLLSMLLPAMGLIRSLGRATICGSNLHYVGQAVQTYTSSTQTLDPWWYCNGHDFPWEPPRPYTPVQTSPLQTPATWGNPAVALTLDFGPGSTRQSDYIVTTSNAQNYLTDARPFFCPLFNFRYEKHYSRYGHGNLWMVDNSTKVWGTYVWMWPKKYNDWGGDNSTWPKPKPTLRQYSNQASENVLMIDYFGYDWQPTWWADKSMMEYRQSMYHWKAVMLDGSVQDFSKLKDVFSWLWTNQPSGPRQYFDPTYPAVFNMPSYVPG